MSVFLSFMCHGGVSFHGFFVLLVHENVLKCVIFVENYLGVFVTFEEIWDFFV